MPSYHSGPNVHVEPNLMTPGSYDVRIFVIVVVLIMAVPNTTLIEIRFVRDKKDFNKFRVSFVLLHKELRKIHTPHGVTFMKLLDGT